MKRIKADFDLINAWETWILEVPDDWEPGDELIDDTVDGIEFVEMVDSGNQFMEIVEATIKEVD